MRARCLLVCCVVFPVVMNAHGQARRPVAVVPSGPVAVIDTTAGRITCRLFSTQAPEVTGNFIGLATGSRTWTDPATGAAMQGKPFYDGTALYGVTDGVGGGDRSGLGKGTAGPALAMPARAAMPLDRDGLLAMRVSKKEGVSSSLFVLMEHADTEYQGSLYPFGLCDAESIRRVESISHALLSVGNHPLHPVGINHIAIVAAGDALPAPAADVAEAAIVPGFAPEPAPAIPAPEPTGPTAVIETTLGTMTCRLFNETPIATANFIGLATGTKDWHNPATRALMHGKRFYDGLHFNRVIPDFMVEQGDLPGDGEGDGKIGFQFANEIVPGLTFDRPGRLAYANYSPTTNASEFFVTEHTSHPLDGNYTVFGQCDEASVVVAAAIARVPRDAKNRPLKAVTIKSVTIRQL